MPSKNTLQSHLTRILVLLFLLPAGIYAEDIDVTLGGKSATPLGKVVNSRFAEEHSLPKLVSGDNPVHPIPLLFSGEAGYASIEFTIDVDGSTRDFVAVEYNHLFYANAAIRALRKWKFIPAKKGGEPVTSRATQRFVYNAKKEQEVGAVPIK